MTPSAVRPVTGAVAGHETTSGAMAFAPCHLADLVGGRIPPRAGQPVTVLAPMPHRRPVRGDGPGRFDPAGVGVRRRFEKGVGCTGGVPYAVPGPHARRRRRGAEEWLNGLIADGRYVEDEYAGG
ncbi:hypothetical protein ACYF6T_01075 [Streptomyces sp. 7R007]